MSTLNRRKKAMKELVNSQIRQHEYEEKARLATIQINFALVRDETEPYKQGKKVGESLMADPWEFEEEDLKDFAYHVRDFGNGIADSILKAINKPKDKV